MNKGTHFNGQPMYGQLINLLDKEEILKFSLKYHGERYVKHFDAYQHLTVMLYAVIKRFDSLREITDSMFPEARKLAHLGIRTMPRRSTLSDANARRPEKVFEDIYRSLYVRYKGELSSDSRKRQIPSWLNRLANNRFYYHIPVLQPPIQGCRQTSQMREEEGRHKSTYKHTRKRRRALRHQIHLCCYQ